ncbi:hypothetical protein ACFX15_002544 [Malus domestica]
MLIDNCLHSFPIDFFRLYVGLSVSVRFDHYSILPMMLNVFRKDYLACLDDETFWFLASVYSRSHYNVSLSKEFEGGITNGAFWYDGLKHYNLL